MKNLFKKFSTIFALCVLIVSVIIGANSYAETLNEKATSKVVFGEYEQVSIGKEKTVLKIVMKEKGTFELDFSPDYLTLYAQLYDNNNKLIGYTYNIKGELATDGVDVLKLQNLGYEEELEAGTYYLELWRPGDSKAKKYTYFARFNPSDKASIEICVNVKKNKSIQLGTIFNNTKNKSIKWSSSKKGVASVNSKGRVKGIKKGTTVIKAFNSSGLMSKVKIKVV